MTNKNRNNQSPGRGKGGKKKSNAKTPKDTSQAPKQSREVQNLLTSGLSIDKNNALASTTSSNEASSSTTTLVGNSEQLSVLDQSKTTSVGSLIDNSSQQELKRSEPTEVITQDLKAIGSVTPASAVENSELLQDSTTGTPKLNLKGDDGKDTNTDSVEVTVQAIQEPDLSNEPKTLSNTISDATLQEYTNDKVTDMQLPFSSSHPKGQSEHEGMNPNIEAMPRLNPNSLMETKDDMESGTVKILQKPTIDLDNTTSKESGDETKSSKKPKGMFGKAAKHIGNLITGKPKQSKKTFQSQVPLAEGVSMDTSTLHNRNDSERPDEIAANPSNDSQVTSLTHDSQDFFGSRQDQDLSSIKDKDLSSSVEEYTPASTGFLKDHTPRGFLDPISFITESIKCLPDYIDLLAENLEMHLKAWNRINTWKELQLLEEDYYSNLGIYTRSLYDSLVKRGYDLSSDTSPHSIFFSTIVLSMEIMPGILRRQLIQNNWNLNHVCSPQAFMQATEHHFEQLKQYRLPREGALLDRTPPTNDDALKTIEEGSPDSADVSTYEQDGGVPPSQSHQSSPTGSHQKLDGGVPSSQSHRSSTADSRQDLSVDPQDHLQPKTYQGILMEHYGRDHNAESVDESQVFAMDPIDYPTVLPPKGQTHYNGRWIASAKSQHSIKWLKYNPSLMDELPSGVTMTQRHWVGRTLPDGSICGPSTVLHKPGKKSIMLNLHIPSRNEKDLSIKPEIDTYTSGFTPLMPLVPDSNYLHRGMPEARKRQWESNQMSIHVANGLARRHGESTNFRDKVIHIQDYEKDPTPLIAEPPATKNRTLSVNENQRTPPHAHTDDIPVSQPVNSVQEVQDTLRTVHHSQSDDTGMGPDDAKSRSNVDQTHSAPIDGTQRPPGQRRPNRKPDGLLQRDQHGRIIEQTREQSRYSNADALKTQTKDHGASMHHAEGNHRSDPRLAPSAPAVLQSLEPFQTTLGNSDNFSSSPDNPTFRGKPVDLSPIRPASVHFGKDGTDYRSSSEGSPKPRTPSEVSLQAMRSPNRNQSSPSNHRANYGPSISAAGNYQPKARSSERSDATIESNSSSLSPYHAGYSRDGGFMDPNYPNNEPGGPPGYRRGPYFPDRPDGTGGGNGPGFEGDPDPNRMYPRPYIVPFKTKVDKRDYIKITNMDQYRRWSMHTVATMRAHGLVNLLNKKYVPFHPAEWQNFHNQQAFFYTVLIAILQTIEGKRLVLEHREDGDARMVLHRFHKVAHESTHAIIKSDQLNRELQLARLDNSWNKSYAEFINDIIDKAEEYNDMQHNAAIRLSGAQITAILQNAVSSVPVLNQVKLHNMHQMVQGAPPLTFSQYLQCLQSVAAVEDEKTLRRGRRNAHVTDMHEDVPSEPTAEITEYQINESRRASAPAARVSDGSWSRMSSQEKRAWTQLSPETRLLILGDSGDNNGRSANVTESHSAAETEVNIDDTDEAPPATTLDVNQSRSNPINDAHPADPRRMLSGRPKSTPAKRQGYISERQPTGDVTGFKGEYDPTLKFSNYVDYLLDSDNEDDNATSLLSNNHRIQAKPRNIYNVNATTREDYIGEEHHEDQQKDTVGEDNWHYDEAKARASYIDYHTNEDGDPPTDGEEEASYLDYDSDGNWKRFPGTNRNDDQSHRSAEHEWDPDPNDAEAAMAYIRLEYPGKTNDWYDANYFDQYFSGIPEREEASFRFQDSYDEYQAWKMRRFKGPNSLGKGPEHLCNYLPWNKVNGYQPRPIEYMSPETEELHSSRKRQVLNVNTLWSQPHVATYIDDVQVAFKPHDELYEAPWHYQGSDSDSDNDDDNGEDFW